MKGGTVLAIVFQGVLAACIATTEAESRRDPGTGTQAASTQLIVRFSAGTDPGSEVLLSALSAAVGAPVAYLRPLSGGAHLLRIAAPPDSAAEATRRLKQRPEILDVQPDLPVRPR